MLSDSPPERDVIWTEEGVQGAGRFVQRLWRLVGEIADRIDGNGAESIGELALQLRRAAHKALAGVQDDLERLRFNRSVAQIYELANVLTAALPRCGTAEASAIREAAGILIQLVAPMMPHLAEECWQALGREDLVAAAAWPAVDASLLIDDTIVLPVQVDGKRRDEVSVPADASNEQIQALVMGLESVQRAMEGRGLRKFIVVPKRIVNVVTG